MITLDRLTIKLLTKRGPKTGSHSYPFYSGVSSTRYEKEQVNGKEVVARLRVTHEAAALANVLPGLDINEIEPPATSPNAS